MSLQVFAFPTFIFGSLLIIDLLEFVEGGYKITMSLMTVFFYTFFVLLANIPFVAIGSWFGQATTRLEPPIKPNRMPR